MNPALLSVARCPGCGGEITLVGEESPSTSIVSGSVSCRDCSAVYHVRDQILDLRSTERTDQAIERDLRDELARTYATASSKDAMKLVARNHFVPRMVHEARAFASDYGAEDWLLDIGVGWGWYWTGVQRPNILAVDLSIDSLLVARKLLGNQVDRNIHLVCADATNIPVGDQAVDGIWSIQTLQHIPGDGLASCLAGCARVLKTGGGLQIYWLNWASGIRLLRRFLGKRLHKERTEPYYLQYLTGSELASLVARYFTVGVETEYSEVVFHPEFRLPHRLPLGWLDRQLSRWPLINRAIARQVSAKIAKR
jgi:ubiquinone/menaquinone biosynthesis C-methylase UbiE/uncharacterized protein YbaR (Trm112 family)